LNIANILKISEMIGVMMNITGFRMVLFEMVLKNVPSHGIVGFWRSRYKKKRLSQNTPPPPDALVRVLLL
jgi:hypothetical protein